MDFFVLLPILTPLATAAICLLLWNRPKLQIALSLLGGGTLLACGIGLLSVVMGNGIQVVQLGNWPAPFGITIVADLLSGIMVAITGLIGLVVLLFSLSGVDAQRQGSGYHPILHLLLLGVCGAFLTGDMFNMYVWFEVMLIASFVLVALGGEKSQLEGAVKYVTLNLIASTFFLAAAGVLYGTVGTLNMADLARHLSSGTAGSVPSVAGAILLISFGLKAAVFPLFFWLPASYHTPPAAVSAVMAGLLTKVGVYALVRMFTLLYAHDFAYTQPILLLIAGTTMVTGVLGAAAQSEFRRILSFHIISQIGYMILGLAICTPLALAGTVFYLIHHIVVKTNLFLIAGITESLKGTGDLRVLGGLYRERLWLAILFLVPALSLAGLPPLSGFWAKLIVIRATIEAEHYVLLATSLVVGLLTLYSMTKIWSEVFWKGIETNGDETRSTSARFMAPPAIMLACITVAIGVAAEPVFMLADETARQLLDPTQYIEAVLPGI